MDSNNKERGLDERKKKEKAIAIISIECSVKVHPRHGGGE